MLTFIFIVLCLYVDERLVPLPLFNRHRGVDLYSIAHASTTLAHRVFARVLLHDQLVEVSGGGGGVALGQVLMIRCICVNFFCSFFVAQWFVLYGTCRLQLLRDALQIERSIETKRWCCASEQNGRREQIENRTCFGGQSTR